MSSRSHKLDLTHFAPSGLPTPDAMMMALLEQQQLLADKDEALAESASRIQNQKNQIAVLQEQIKLLTMQKYASKSEQNLLQKDFFADEAETLADGEIDANDGEIDEPEEKLRRAPRKKSGKKPLSPDLPRIQHFITLTDEEREGAVETFFVKVKEELDIVPATVQVIEIMQEKAVFLDEDGERSLKAAVRPPHPIGRSIASTNLLSWVVSGKYVDGLPLYRMEQILSRYGGEITRTTLANWVMRLSEALGPWLERLMWHLMKVDYLQCDETRLQVLREPGMSATGDKWIWVLRGGPPGKTLVCFNYDKSRGGKVVERLLADYEGRYFQCDGYAGYDAPCAAKQLVQLGCWDHARRKVCDAIKAQPKPEKGKPSVAMVMLSHIDALYRLERQWNEQALDDEQRHEQRQKKAIPKLNKLRQWLEQKQPKVPKDTLTRKAIDYTLNQWDHLVNYCQHGQLRLSNILAENAIRPFALGRKAWLFSNSPEGAHASAAMFTLVETAKANGLEPYAYVQHVIEHIATADTDEALDALMPWNMK